MGSQPKQSALPVLGIPGGVDPAEFLKDFAQNRIVLQGLLGFSLGTMAWADQFAVQLARGFCCDARQTRDTNFDMRTKWNKAKMVPPDAIAVD